MNITMPTVVFGDLLGQADLVVEHLHEGNAVGATTQHRMMLEFLAKQSAARLQSNDAIVKAMLGKLGHKIAVNTTEWLAEHTTDSAVTRYWTFTQMHCLAEQLASTTAAHAA